MRCLSTRGENKGLLKKNCPSYSKDPEACGAWNGIMMDANFYKVNIGTVMLLSDKGRAVEAEVSAWSTRHRNITQHLDHDRNTLETWGVW